MYGAILGDIIGSPLEFDRGEKTKNFVLFSPGAAFTDDTVMTIAVAEALLDAGIDAEDRKFASCKLEPYLQERKGYEEFWYLEVARLLSAYHFLTWSGMVSAIHALVF